MEEEEAERLRLDEIENRTVNDRYEHCAFGDIDLMGLSEDELDNQCDQLFRYAPIEFQPWEGNSIDRAIQDIIQSYDITIPIVHIKNKLFLIGHNRINCDLKNDNLMCRVGGGYEKFIDYVPKNHRYF